MQQAKTDDGRNAHPAALLRGQDGFTLIEALVAMSMFIVVLFAVFASAEFATKASSREQERNASLSEAGTGTARIVSELRRAYALKYPEGSSITSTSEIDFYEHIPEGGTSAAKQILIKCNYKPTGATYDECVRYQYPTATTFVAGTPPSGITAEVLVQRVLNETTSDATDPVFKNLTYPTGSSFPTYGEIVIHTPGKGGLSTSSYTHQVVIKNSFFIRDLEFGKL